MFCNRIHVLLCLAVVISINCFFINATPFNHGDLNKDSLISDIIEQLRKDSSFSHNVVTRQAAEEEPKSEKQKEPTTTEPLELDPETESVMPNKTRPDIPGLPDIPGFPGPLSPPGLFPPQFYPGPFQPPNLTPPEFDPCSNPWGLDPLPDETKKTKQDKLLSKMQCDFHMLQQKMAQFYKSIEAELNELKKINYNTVARLARLESILRSASPF